MSNLLKNTMVYGIGNFGSRLIGFLLLPLLTFFLLPEEIGFYDLCLTTIFLIMPVLTIQLREGAFRFLLDADAFRQKQVLTAVFSILLVLFLSFLVISLILPSFVHIDYYPYIIVALFVYGFYEVYSQTVRGIYSPMAYTVMSIITSLLTFFISIGLLYATNKGISCVFIGNISARAVAMLSIELYYGKILAGIRLRWLDKKTVRDLLRYSYPLLGSALLLALIFSVGKYCIRRYCGLEMNGYFAIAEKFSLILQVAGFSFYQAWQELSITNLKQNKDIDAFSSIFSNFVSILALCVVVISFGLRLFSFMLIKNDYLPGVQYVNIYSIAIFFYCLSCFFEVAYQYSKKTKLLFHSILFTAIIISALSYVLIPTFGVYGMVFASLFSFVCLFIYRYLQTRRLLQIKLNLNFYIALVFLFLSSACFYMQQCVFVDSLILLLSLVLLSYIFLSYLKNKRVSNV